MAIQNLNVGDTGQQLVDKFNNNNFQYREKYSVAASPDDVVVVKYTTPVQLSIKFFNAVTSATYRRKLDDGVDTYTAETDLSTLNTWLSGLAADTDVDIEITTNASASTYIQLNLDES